MADLLTELCRVPGTNKRIEEHFYDDPEEIIAEIIRDELSKQGKTLKHLKREGRIELIQALWDRGVFNMRNASPIIANLLGVSRFTIYNYLNAIPGRSK